LAIGLAPYAYLLVADGPASWGTVASPSALLATILRREYGSFALDAGGAVVAWPASVAACLATIARSWLWLPAVSGAARLGVRIWRPAHERRSREDQDDERERVALETRWGWAMLAASLVLTGPVLASRFNIEPRGIGLFIVRRFHLLPTLLLAIPVAAACDL